MTFEEFTNNVIQWADKRHLLTPSDMQSGKDITKQLMQSKQLLKFHEECGELTEDYLKGNDAHLMDSFGDVLVTLVIFAEQKGIALDECWEKAWSHIANRKGKTINGIFVKEADLGERTKETQHLLSTKANREALKQALKESKAIEQQLEDEEGESND